MASNIENMDIDPIPESSVQLEIDTTVAKKLYEGRPVKSEDDKELSRLGMKNRCPKGSRR